MEISMIYKINGDTYAYDIKGEGPAVLLLHGFTGSQRTWDDVKNELVKQFQVITLDLPGHGKTNTSPKTMAQCCYDIEKFLEYLNVSNVHLLGYSMGGRVALSFTMLYPDRISSLMLESSSPGLKTTNERQNRMKKDEQLAKMIEEKGIKHFVHFWENIPLFDTQKQLPDAVQAKIRQERLQQNAVGLANSLRYMGTGKQPSWWDKLEQLTHPTYLIVGGCDQKFVAINQEMKTKLQQGFYTVVPEAGHAIHIERPSIFSNHIKIFLQEQQS